MTDEEKHKESFIQALSIPTCDRIKCRKIATFGVYDHHLKEVIGEFCLVHAKEQLALIQKASDYREETKID